MIRDVLLPSQDIVHLWKIRLADESWDRYAGVLANDEVHRIAGYKNLRDQAHARRSRIAVRLLLARYLRRDPSQIVFVLGRFGKPEIFASKLHFNLSHSDENAILAISSSQVGVDLELRRRCESVIDGIAELVFHPLELNVFSRKTKEEKMEMFWELWTQKEAYCKYLGAGLNKPLKEIRFMNLDELGAALVVDKDGMNGNCYIHRIFCIDNHASSICSASRELRVVRFVARPSELVGADCH